MAQVIVECRGFIIFIQMKAPCFLETEMMIFNIFLGFILFYFYFIQCTGIVLDEMILG